MARNEKQKLKMLLLRDLLVERSDADAPLTAQDIVDHLKAQGVTCERKSIYDDIACLQQYGMAIEIQRGRGGGYYLAQRDFELPELKLLVDAVQSSRFLTQKKSLELIKKLEKLAGRSAGGTLQRNVVVSGRVKNMDESIYYAVDAIHEAISKNSQIRFRYFEWGVDRTRIYRDGDYTASPYALVWDNEFYYLVAHSARHGLTHYRVDHMSDIRQTGEPRWLEQGKQPDLSVYGKNVFSMYSGEVVQVKMQFANSLAGVVLDRFGRDAILVPEDENTFTYTATIAVSPTFLGWLSQFGAKAKVLYPESVVEAHRKLLLQTLAQYT